MPSHKDTLASRLARELRREADRVAPPATVADRVRKYRDDPVGFAIDILKISPWSKQAEVLRSVVHSKRVAICSGHKTGKSTALAILALWFYCVHPSARVVIMAATDRQVNGIIWREVRRLVLQAKRAGIELPGADTISIKAASGLTDPSDLSEIRGYTAKEAEGAAGVSGGWILYLIDEASGVPEKIFEAIEGNRAGGNAWLYLISNPTRAEGTFYDAFHAKNVDAIGAHGYLTFQIDSRESPNCTGEWRNVPEWDMVTGEWRERASYVPGMATPEWVEEKAAEWGENSAMFSVRVAGNFVAAEEARVFQLALITEMVMRHDDTQPAGRIYLGVDPAGDGDGGDESGFVARRGRKVLEVRGRRGLAPAAHIAEVQDLLRTVAGRRDLAQIAKELQPVIIVDSEGDAGWRVYVALREHADRTGEFEVARIMSSNKAARQPLIFDRIRDELWGVAREWARDGGSMPSHGKLERDLHAPEFKSNLRGRLKLTPKKDLRASLGRSPDLGDAFVLCCWEPFAARAIDHTRRVEHQPETEAGSLLDDLDGLGEALDPYAGADAFR